MKTVLPDFVLNFSVTGFFTVFTASNLTFWFAMGLFYHFSGYLVGPSIRVPMPDGSQCQTQSPRDRVANSSQGHVFRPQRQRQTSSHGGQQRNLNFSRNGPSGVAGSLALTLRPENMSL